MKLSLEPNDPIFQRIGTKIVRPSKSHLKMMMMMIFTKEGKKKKVPSSSFKVNLNLIFKVECSMIASF